MDGSFEDGYNDGFTEGTIFGATDYRMGLPLDWLDAMWDYRDGTDLYIEELGTGTGSSGPVFLYEYGVDPRDYIVKAATVRGQSPIRHRVTNNRTSPRAQYAAAPLVEKTEETAYNPDEISYRELTEKVRQELSIAPTASDRAEGREISLTDTWLDRVNVYRQNVGK